MSLILLEGFDDGLHDDRWFWSAPDPASSAYSRIGRVVAFNSYAQYFRYSIKAADQDDLITVGFWGTPTNIPSGLWGRRQAFLQLWSDSASTYHIGFDFTATGQLRVLRGDDTVLGITDVIWPSLLVSRYIEIQVRLHDSAGSVSIWSDGASMLNLTSIDTRNGGTVTEFDTIQFNDGSVESRAAGSKFILTDIYITNEQGASPYNSRLGDVVIETLFPDSNGTYNDFAGSDGNSVDNYLLVDESPDHDDDATYVQSGVDAARDSYGFDDLVSTSGAIRGIMVTAAARNLGAAENCQLSTRIAGTDYDSDTLVVPGVYDAETKKIWELSPATGVNWTVDEINAAEFGIENVV